MCNYVAYNRFYKLCFFTFITKHMCRYVSGRPLVTLFASLHGYGRLDVSWVASSCTDGVKQNIDGVTERYAVTLEQHDAERSASSSVTTTGAVWVSSRAILCPRNNMVDHMNDRVLDMFPGDTVTYLSAAHFCHILYKRLLSVNCQW